MALSHWASIAFSLVTASAFGTVALVLWRRRVSEGLQGANNAFSLWWAALAAAAFTAAGTTALAVLGIHPLPLFVGASILNLALICVALWGLLYYLIVLIADARAWKWPLAVAYTALAAYLCLYILQSGPRDVVVSEWGWHLSPRPVHSTVRAFLLLGLVFAPQIAAALTYLSLVFRVEGRTAKLRILLVGMGIILWFGAALVNALVGQATGHPASDGWQWASRVMGLVAALATLYAFIGLDPGRRTRVATDSGQQEHKKEDERKGPPQTLHPVAATPLAS